jgi:tetratricopeptide (TPR) repeat protein
MLLRLAAGLGRFWQARGYPQEGIRWLEIALRESETPPGARARALCWLGQLVSHNGENERATHLYRESVRLARAVGDGRLLSMALRDWNYASVALGDYEEARRLIEEAVAVSREGGYQREEAYNLLASGELLIVQGQLDRVERILLGGLAIGRQSGDALPVCHALVDLGGIYLSRGDPVRARAALHEALALERQINVTFISLAAFLLLGDLARIEGDLAGAIAWYRHLLRRFPSLNRTVVVSALRRYAGACDLAGAHRRAARIFGAVSTIPDDPRRFVWFYLQFGFANASATPEALGEEVFAAAFAEGQAMTLEDAAKLALTEGDDEAPGV